MHSFVAVEELPDAQKDLKIRSLRTVGEIISGLCRGYNGSIKGIYFLDPPRGLGLN